jgi:hypothetical protein
MKSFRQNGLVGLLAVALLIGLLLTLPLQPGDVQAAPAALVTPAAANSISAITPRVITLYDGAITADTRGTCFDEAGYAYIDTHYKIDQGTTNTVTLTLQHAVDTAISYETLDTVVSANAADADAMVQSLLWGRYICLYADVTNTNTVTITARALVR